ncbi:ABC transporter ATP-binding protein [Thalassospira alkalitolerans]|uniref:ABC transporter ATP-binding protein n=1 Tax=Thalassospira alkalitolerans TaxID=1293890 RepID=UPI003AA7DDDF
MKHAFGILLERVPVSAIILMLQILSGFAEGIGFIGIFQILIIGTGQSDDSSVLADVTNSVMDYLSIPSEFAYMLGIVMVFLMAKFVILLSSRWIVSRVAAQISYEYQQKLIRRLSKSSIAHIQGLSTGAVANAANVEISKGVAIYDSTLSMISGSMIAMFYLVMSMTVSIEATMGAGLVGVVVVLAGSGLVSRSKRIALFQTDSIRALTSRLVSGFSDLKPLKAMNREDGLYCELDEVARDYRNAKQQYMFVKSLLDTSREPLSAVLICSLAIAGHSFGIATVAEILFVGIIAQRTAANFSQVQLQYQNVVTNAWSMESVKLFISDAERHREQWKGTLAPKLTKHIVFDDVEFGYDDRRIFKNASVRINKGELAVLLGPSGTGKTTFLDLIVGLAKTQKGQVRIDDANLEDIDIALWRDKIGYVPQEYVLYNDTVRNNITLNNAGIDDASLGKALDLAGASAFVANLPGGLDYLVGERGSLLSGGQRQRLSIARALVRAPDLLVLDEPTAALDEKSEKDLIKTLDGLRGHITIIAVTHRPMLSSIADRILTLDNGQLIEKIKN